MAQAFYPTQDGKLGNLEKLSDIELGDVIRRQENLLKKKSFLNNLPDKGAKITDRLAMFTQEQSRRNHSLPDIKFVPSDSITRSCNNNASAPEQRQMKIVKDPAQSDLDHNDLETMESDNTDERLAAELHSRLNMEDNDGGKGADGQAKTKHYYEVAIDRAQENVFAGKKEPFKLNRKLRINNLQELPDDIKKSKETLPHVTRRIDHVKVPEESAVVTPIYKYNTIQLVDLQESLQLQTSQKQRQEELQAQMAAEKLSQRLNIKLEAYNPEGVDMSYRDTTTADLDSDDEDTVCQGSDLHITHESSESEADET